MSMSRDPYNLLSLFSHELKSPVASSLSLLSLLELKQDRLSKTEIAAYHKKIVEKLQYLTITTDSLFDVLALEKKQFTIATESLPLIETIELAVAVVKRERGVVIPFIHPKEIITVNADQPRLLQAIRYLLYTAINCSEAETVPSLQLSLLKKSVQLQLDFVSEGIAEKDRKKVLTLEYGLEKMNGKKITPSLYVAVEVLRFQKAVVTFEGKRNRHQFCIEFPLDS